jgi:hypothetical protein
MKNLTLISLSIICLLFGKGILAQTDPTLSHWKVDGNLADTNKFIGTTNSVPITFKTNGTEKMRLTASGNLGLGVLNPQAKLDVIGTVKFRNGFQLPGILEYTNPITPPAYFLVIDANGNVTKRAFSKDTPYPNPKPDPKPTTICDLQNSDGTKGILNPTWTSGLNKLYSQCPQVYVGIGTTTPRVNLDVLGTTFTNRLAIGNIDPATISPFFHLKTNVTSATNTTPLFLIENGSASKLLQLTNQGVFKLKSIFTGTTDATNVFLIENPTTKLMQLNNQGLLQVREVKVDLAVWPDYVFEKNYDLKSLKQVENFIQKEGHLPNVPSAAEVIENGANIGEMNKILLEKVEELTLYLIEQDKRIKALENSIK